MADVDFVHIATRFMCVLIIQDGSDDGVQSLLLLRRGIGAQRVHAVLAQSCGDDAQIVHGCDTEGEVVVLGAEVHDQQVAEHCENHLRNRPQGTIECHQNVL